MTTTSGPLAGHFCDEIEGAQALNAFFDSPRERERLVDVIHAVRLQPRISTDEIADVIREHYRERLLGED